MATYNSLDIFGIDPVIRTRPNPAAHQRTAYPGVAGVQDVRLGSRGGTSEATGTLYGTTLSDLAAFEDLWAAYVVDGGAYTLVDTKGRTWPSVILDSFEPEGEIHPFDPVWGYTRRYRATFFHLI
jgi:hypothetical protein